MIKYYLLLDNIRLMKIPVMRLAGEIRRRKRIHDTYLCLPSFTEMHKYVSPVLYGLTLDFKVFRLTRQQSVCSR